LRFCKYFDVESTGRYVRLRLDSRQPITVAELEKVLESMPLGYICYYYIGVGEWKEHGNYVELDHEEEFIDASIYDCPAQVCENVTSDWLDKTVVRFEVDLVMENQYRY